MKTFFRVWLKILLVLGITQASLGAHPNAPRKPSPAMLARLKKPPAAGHALRGSSRHSAPSALDGAERETLTLYHATSSEHLDSIAEGIRAEVGNFKTDHGEGFYTTLSEKQATDWARHPRFSARGVVVGFAVKRHELRALHRISTGDMSEAEFVGFLEKNRFKGGAAHDVQADIVEGRMLMNVKELKRDMRYRFNPGIGLVLEGHQLSFHTAAGARVLDGGRRSIERIRE